MNDYIVEFEHLYSKMHDHDMKLPDTILAFKVLDGANLRDDERKLDLAVANDLNFDTMKSALKRIFSKPDFDATMSSSAIKPEEAFYSKKSFSYSPRSKVVKSGTGGRKEKMNLMNKHGQVLRCIVCDSKMHWANQCPHATQKDYVNINSSEQEEELCEEVELVLMSSATPQELDKQEIFVAEATKSAVIDTACTKTVAGEKWFNDFIDCLPLDRQKNVKESVSDTTFKFGDGRKVAALKKAIIPIKIGDKKCNIETEIVEENIPLLLSKSSLKKAGAIIDMQNDKATMFGKETKLCLSTSGHYCIDISPN